MNFLQIESVIKKKNYTIDQLVKMGAFKSRYYIDKAVKENKLRYNLVKNGKKLEISRESIIAYFELMTEEIKKPLAPKKKRLRKLKKAEASQIQSSKIVFTQHAPKPQPVPEPKDGIFRSFLNLFKSNPKLQEATRG